MKKLIMALVLSIAPVWAFASAGGACGELHECEVAPINLHDKASLQKGAQLFLSYCSGCHSAKYLRYERMSQDLDIDPALVEKYMMFTSDKIGDPINSHVSPKDQAKWFGNAPPEAMGDLVNFMTYMAEPSRTTREAMGFWVLLFLAVLFIPVYFLNKEFWKDVK